MCTLLESVFYFVNQGKCNIEIDQIFKMLAVGDCILSKGSFQKILSIKVAVYLENRVG